jgi:hypothetical protein
MTSPKLHRCEDRQQRLVAFRELLGQAQQALLFYAPRLDAKLLQDPEALATLQHFLTSSPRHQLRVLVLEPEALVRECPRLLALCRRLPSRCSLRVPAAEAEPLDEALYCADRHHALHRPPGQRTQYLYMSHAPLRVAPLYKRVDDMWELAQESADLQQLSI